MNETAKTIALERFISDRSKQKLTTTSVELQAFELGFDAGLAHSRSKVKMLRAASQNLVDAVEQASKDSMRV